MTTIDPLAPRPNLDFSKGVRGSLSVQSDAFDQKLFDKQCALYRTFRDEQDTCKTAADELKVWLLAQIERYGLVPTNAEKSRRIEAALFIGTVTTGMTVEVNDERVVELELLLAKARLSAKFPLLFKRRTEYSLAKTADDAMTLTAWPKRFREEITSLYGRCFRPKPRTPSLEVVSRAEIAEREAEKTAKAAKPRARKVAA